MNKNIFVTAVLILIMVTIFWLIGKNVISRNGSFLSPMLSKQINLSGSSPTPSIVPKTFKFDASTDLKKELDSINPQVLDNDFE